MVSEKKGSNWPKRSNTQNDNSLFQDILYTLFPVNSFENLLSGMFEQIFMKLLPFLIYL